MQQHFEHGPRMAGRLVITEDALCLAFAERVKDSSEFASWVINQTKFRKLAGRLRLLHHEQMTLRPRKFWWRHWWCEFPEQVKKGGEIDIFMVFQLPDDNQRIALHFENKTNDATFREGQPEGYSKRARHMANRPEYLSYQDYETILIAPRLFRERYRDKSDLFDCYISYEDIAKFVPEFGRYLIAKASSRRTVPIRDVARSTLSS